MKSRAAITLIELLVVLAILAALIGLLLPAVQSARRKSQEAVCKNNLHQLNGAIAQFTGAHKRLPNPNSPDLIGGWTIEILPFLEEANLQDQLSPGGSIDSVDPDFLRPPSILRCPQHDSSAAPTTSAVEAGHYVFVAHGRGQAPRRQSFVLYDTPLAVAIPWAAGPEMPPRSVTRLLGPHRDGFFRASGFQQRVDFAPYDPD